MKSAQQPCAPRVKVRHLAAATLSVAVALAPAGARAEYWPARFDTKAEAEAVMQKIDACQRCDCRVVPLAGTPTETISNHRVSVHVLSDLSTSVCGTPGSPPPVCGKGSEPPWRSPTKEQWTAQTQKCVAEHENLYRTGVVPALGGPEVGSPAHRALPILSDTQDPATPSPGLPAWCSDLWPTDNARWSPIAEHVKRHREDGTDVLVVITDGFESIQIHGNPSAACVKPVDNCDELDDSLAESVAEFVGAGHHAILVIVPPLAPEYCKRGNRSEPREFANPCRKATTTDAARCVLVQLSSLAPPEGELPALQAELRTVAQAVLDGRLDYAIELPPAYEFGQDVALLGDARRWKCSGVWVSKNAILTARHCLPLSVAYLGDDRHEAGFQYSVVEVRTHPDERFDLAIVHAEQSAPIGRPLRRRLGDNDPPMGEVHFVGYGATDSTGHAGFGRRREDVLTASGWGCSGGRARTTGCRPGIEMVLSGAPGGDTCLGDSGGPVFEVIGRSARCRQRLLGITSRRVADAHAACGGGGIYVRVDAAAEFIEKAISDWRPNDGDAEENPK